MILDRFLEIVFVCVVRLIFLGEREDRIDMPRRLVDDLEGEVIDEELYECALGKDILSADLDGECLSQLLRVLCDETYLKISRFYAIISAEKQTKTPVIRRRGLHKRLPISKTISKFFLEIFLEIAMLYGARFFRGSNKKELKALVNTGGSASFIVCYHRAKSVNFRWVIVP